MLYLCPHPDALRIEQTRSTELGNRTRDEFPLPPDMLHFMCPVTREPMRKPCALPSGHMVELEVAEQITRCPITRELIPRDFKRVVNIPVRNHIRDKVYDNRGTPWAEEWIRETEERTRVDQRPAGVESDAEPWYDSESGSDDSTRDAPRLTPVQLSMAESAELQVWNNLVLRDVPLLAS